MINVSGKIFAQFFICCSKCDGEKLLGDYKPTNAVKTAKRLGWSQIPLNKKWICPSCNSPKGESVAAVP